MEVNIITNDNTSFKRTFTPSHRMIAKDLSKVGAVQFDGIRNDLKELSDKNDLDIVVNVLKGKNKAESGFKYRIYKHKPLFKILFGKIDMNYSAGNAISAEINSDKNIAEVLFDKIKSSANIFAKN